MTTYAVGDVQGCCDDLERLLEALAFDPAKDTIWFTGDLVNRGPQSLAVLRRIAGLGDTAVCVLGNHDLHLLAIAAGVRKPRGRDTLSDILSAPDRDELVDWLRRRPLVHYDEERDALLVHAGLVPQWDRQDAVTLAAEVEARLRGDDWASCVGDLFGETPSRWRKNLKGRKRRRFIVSAMTRIRYCDANGRLNLKFNGRPGTEPAGLYPWFDVPGRRSATSRLIFGHWATLGLVSRDGLLALDTGCVWGGQLTAMPLDGPDVAVQVMCPGYQATNR